MSNVIVNHLLTLPTKVAVNKNAMFLFAGVLLNFFVLTWYYIYEVAEFEFSLVDSRFFSFFVLVGILLNALFVLRVTVNYLFLLRFFLIWVLGFFSALSYTIFANEVYLANFGAQFQTVEITMFILLCFHTACSSICLALCYLSSNNFNKLILYEVSNIDHKVPLFRRPMFIIGCIFSLGFTLFLVWREGGLILISGVVYREELNESVNFGAGGVFVIIGLSMVMISLMGERSSTIRNGLFFVFIVLFLQLLAGKRADNLFPILIVFVLLISHMRGGKEINIFWTGVFCCLIIALGEFVGKARVGSEFTLDFLKQQEAGSVFQMFTGNQVLGTMYTVKYNLDDGYFDFLYGLSYFEYFLKLPPAFLGLDRPEELEGKMYIGSQIMAQGGIFELSEAYWNFGFIGVVFVPFLITIIFGGLLRGSIRSKAYGYFFFLCFISMGFFALRGVWYQNFAYFRMLTSIIIVFVFFLLVLGNIWRVRSDEKSSR